MFDLSGFYIHVNSCNVTEAQRQIWEEIKEGLSESSDHTLVPAHKDWGRRKLKTKQINVLMFTKIYLYYL